MAEPKIRFKRDNATQYPDLRNAAMGDYYIERNERGEKGLPMLTVSIHSGISDGELGEEELGKRVNRSAEGDLVFNMMRAWQGAVGSTKSTGMVSPAYIVASPNEEIDPTFMNYYVQTKTIINRFNRLSYGALDFRKRLYWDSFVTTEVNIPVIEEQQKIADFLSSVDEVIAASEQEVTNLETQKKAVMKKIFSQEAQFKREDGSDFPEWEEMRIGDICKTYSGGTPKAGNEEYYGGNIPFIRSGEIHSDSTELFLSEQGLKSSSAKMVHVGDIIMALYGATSGEMDISKIEGAINQAILCIKPIEGFDRKFIVEIIRNNKDGILRTYLQGGQGNLSAQIVQDLSFDFPCLEEQRLIADFLSTFDEAISAAKKELELWKKLKKGLLQQMFV